MARYLKLLPAIFAAALLAPAGAYAQALTPLSGVYLSGSAPSGFTGQPFEFFCTAGQALCWPQMQLWDGTTQATVNATDHGLNVHIPSSVTTVNPSITSFASPTSNGAAIGANGPGALYPVIQATASAPISISTATTTQLIALVSGKTIYVTAWDVIAAGTGNITLEYGTGSNCSGGTTALTGAYPLTAQTGISKGSGLGPAYVLPVANALCAVTSAAVQMSGSVSYAQF